MKYKIGVFGSDVSGSKTEEKARELGQALSGYNVIIITGACSGLPYAIAHEAAKNGTEVWGFSPELNREGQKKFTPHDDLSIYTKILYTPMDFPLFANPPARKKYRNVISTATCDAGIIIAGRWGTMNEFTNLYDMGKIVGVLTETGGIANEIETLNKKVVKKSKAKIIFNEAPKKLMELLMAALKERKKADV